MDREPPTPHRVSNGTAPLTEHVLAELADAFRGIRYGVITVTVHDGQVVQIDRTERRRLKAEARTP